MFNNDGNYRHNVYLCKVSIYKTYNNIVSKTEQN